MKWYSTKKYIPPVKEVYYFVRLSCGDIHTAKVEAYKADGDHVWVADENKYIDDYPVTHFAIPDPIEIEPNIEEVCE